MGEYRISNRARKKFKIALRAKKWLQTKVIQWIQYFPFNILNLEKKSDHNKWDWHVIITGAEFKTFDSYRDDVKQLTISSPNKINSFSINMISLWSQCLRLEKKQSVFFSWSGHDPRLYLFGIICFSQSDE